MVLLQNKQRAQRRAVQIQHNKSDQTRQLLQLGTETFALLHQGCC